MSRPVRIAAGCGIWLVALTLGWWALDRHGGAWADGTQGVLPALWEHGTARERFLELEFEVASWARVGDGIFAQSVSQPFEQVGVITEIATDEGPVLGARARSGAWITSARARLYGNAPALTEGSVLSYYRTDTSMAWVIKTMLPPDKRAAIVAEIRTAMDAHRDEVVAALKPIVMDSVREAFVAVQQELPGVIRKHRAELQALGARYQEELIQKEVLPLVREEVFPVARKHVEPIVTEIGKEIWERVSLWSVGSKFVWDQLPLVGGDSLDKEWKRILEEEALPVVRAHERELVAALKNIVRESAANPAVREATKRAFAVIAEDRELHGLVGRILRSAVLENERLRESMQELWKSDRARAAFRLAGDRFEPTVTAIGDRLLGSRSEGISAEFAVVLRNRLLLKDRQWFVLEAPSGGGGGHAPSRLRVVPGTEDLDPFVPNPQPSTGEGPSTGDGR